MLLKRRPPSTNTTEPIEAAPGFEHLDRGALATLGWLKENRVEFVLTGSVAAAVHARSAAKGPVAIVPAPYRRNLERLARGLTDAQVVAPWSWDATATPPKRVTVERLSGSEVLTFAVGSSSVDVVGTGAPAASGTWGATGYQELLYEANRFEPSPGLTVEVASPEDIEHYAHLRRTGTAPEIKITRVEESPAAASPATDSAPAPTAAPGRDSLPGSG
jgi:hypothetical protein